MPEQLTQAQIDSYNETGYLVLPGQIPDAWLAKIHAEIARFEEEAKALLRRPWACNLPLAYVHPRCNRLAKLNPIYEETDLIHSFLQ